MMMTMLLLLVAVPVSTTTTMMMTPLLPNYPWGYFIADSCFVGRPLAI
jgi:hypothetical protein